MFDDRHVESVDILAVQDMFADAELVRCCSSETYHGRSSDTMTWLPSIGIASNVSVWTRVERMCSLEAYAEMDDWGFFDMLMLEDDIAA